MKHEDGYFNGVRNIKIYKQCWLPNGAVKAVLLTVHGLGEHSGRYMNVVNHFVPKGYAVYALDHIGHGKSEGARANVERFSDFTVTLKTYFDMVRVAQPGKPIFLLGHSMGGLIASVYLLEHQADFKGAIISAPLAKISENTPPAAIAIGKIFSSLLPGLGVLAVDATAVSSDPAVVTAYANDPLNFHGKVPARLAAEILSTVARLNAAAATIRLPIILVQGSADKLVDPGGAQMIYDQATSTDKTIKFYEGYYHEVFNEPGRDRVLNDVEAWLEKHLS
jgi:alpha-beta hydrolase superfamily lysophospholipase